MHDLESKSPDGVYIASLSISDSILRVRSSGAQDVLELALGPTIGDDSSPWIGLAVTSAPQCVVYACTRRYVLRVTCGAAPVLVPVPGIHPGALDTSDDEIAPNTLCCTLTGSVLLGTTCGRVWELPFASCDADTARASALALLTAALPASDNDTSAPRKRPARRQSVVDGRRTAGGAGEVRRSALSTGRLDTPSRSAAAPRRPALANPAPATVAANAAAEALADAVASSAAAGCDFQPLLYAPGQPLPPPLVRALVAERLRAGRAGSAPATPETGRVRCGSAGIRSVPTAATLPPPLPLLRLRMACLVGDVSLPLPAPRPAVSVLHVLDNGLVVVMYVDGLVLTVAPRSLECAARHAAVVDLHDKVPAHDAQVSEKGELSFSLICTPRRLRVPLDALPPAAPRLCPAARTAASAAGADVSTEKGAWDTAGALVAELAGDDLLCVPPLLSATVMSDCTMAGSVTTSTAATVDSTNIMVIGDTCGYIYISPLAAPPSAHFSPVTPTVTCHLQVSPNSSPVNNLEFEPANKLIIATTLDGHMMVCSLVAPDPALAARPGTHPAPATWAVITHCRVNDGPITTVKPSPGGHYLVVVAGSRATIYVLGATSPATSAVVAAVLPTADMKSASAARPTDAPETFCRLPLLGYYQAEVPSTVISQASAALSSAMQSATGRTRIALASVFTSDGAPLAQPCGVRAAALSSAMLPAQVRSLASGSLSDIVSVTWSSAGQPGPHTTLYMSLMNGDLLRIVPGDPSATPPVTSPADPQPLPKRLQRNLLVIPTDSAALALVAVPDGATGDVLFAAGVDSRIRVYRLPRAASAGDRSVIAQASVPIATIQTESPAPTMTVSLTSMPALSARARPLAPAPPQANITVITTTGDMATCIFNMPGPGNDAPRSARSLDQLVSAGHCSTGKTTSALFSNLSSCSDGTVCVFGGHIYMTGAAYTVSLTEVYTRNLGLPRPQLFAPHVGYISAPAAEPSELGKELYAQIVGMTVVEAASVVHKAEADRETVIAVARARESFNDLLLKAKADAEAVAAAAAAIENEQFTADELMIDVTGASEQAVAATAALDEVDAAYTKDMSEVSANITEICRRAMETLPMVSKPVELGLLIPESTPVATLAAVTTTTADNAVLAARARVLLSGAAADRLWELEHGGSLPPATNMAPRTSESVVPSSMVATRPQSAAPPPTHSILASLMRIASVGDQPCDDPAPVLHPLEVSGVVGAAVARALAANAQTTLFDNYNNVFSSVLTHRAATIAAVEDAAAAATAAAAQLQRRLGINTATIDTPAIKAAHTAASSGVYADHTDTPGYVAAVQVTDTKLTEVANSVPPLIPIVAATVTTTAATTTTAPVTTSDNSTPLIVEIIGSAGVDAVVAPPASDAALPLHLPPPPCAGKPETECTPDELAALRAHAAAEDALQQQRARLQGQLTAQLTAAQETAAAAAAASDDMVIQLGLELQRVHARVGIITANVPSATLGAPASAIAHRDFVIHMPAAQSVRPHPVPGNAPALQPLPAAIIDSIATYYPLPAQRHTEDDETALELRETVAGANSELRRAAIDECLARETLLAARRSMAQATWELEQEQMRTNHIREEIEELQLLRTTRAVQSVVADARAGVAPAQRARQTIAKIERSIEFAEEVHAGKKALLERQISVLEAKVAATKRSIRALNAEVRAASGADADRKAVLNSTMSNTLDESNRGRKAELLATVHQLRNRLNELGRQRDILRVTHEKKRHASFSSFLLDEMP